MNIHNSLKSVGNKIQIGGNGLYAPNVRESTAHGLGGGKLVPMERHGSEHTSPLRSFGCTVEPKDLILKGTVGRSGRMRFESANLLLSISGSLFL